MLRTFAHSGHHTPQGYRFTNTNWLMHAISDESAAELSELSNSCPRYQDKKTRSRRACVFVSWALGSLALPIFDGRAADALAESTPEVRRVFVAKFSCNRFYTVFRLAKILLGPTCQCL